MCDTMATTVNQEKESFKRTLLAIDKSIEKGNKIIDKIIKQTKKA